MSTHVESAALQSEFNAAEIANTLWEAEQHIKSCGLGDVAAICAKLIKAREQICRRFKLKYDLEAGGYRG